MKTISFLVLLLSLAATLFAQDNPKSLQDPPWVKGLAAKPLVYTVAGMDKVEVQRGLVYERAGTKELKMDVYRPAKSRTKLPAILFVHGGFLPADLLTEPTDWTIFADYGRLVAASGFVGVVFNHRLYDSWASVETSTSDLADAIAYMRSNADVLGVDKDRIALWAFSGGGPLLSLAIRDPQPYIRCIVSYYALLDLTASATESRGGSSEQELLEYSPLQQLQTSTKPLAPMFIARMGQDHPNITASVDHFLPVALAKNMTLTVSNDPEGHHGFDIEDNTDASRAVIGQTMEFVKEHLPGR